jgi:6-phospho-beta-glucosidase
MNVVILGGGSVNTPAFFAALTSQDDWLDGVCLVDRSAEAVERTGKFCQTVAHTHALPVQLGWDTDLASAASGADVVLSMINVGGLAAMKEDLRRLAASGVVGHAATYPQAIRNLPATLEAARAVEQVAPEALWINFANPVSVLCEALALHTRLRCFGICYHAFAMRDDFATLLGVRAERVQVEFFGLNHLGWVTDVQVDGESRMSQLVETIRQGRNKKYNYWYVRPGLIPIDHAFCLYHKGDVWYNRQKGIRGSLRDIALRLGLSGRGLDRESRKRQMLYQIIGEGRVEMLDRFHAQAPWYATCIVPFLRALASDQPHEFVLTWNHMGQVPTLPDSTAESAVILQNGQARRASEACGLPEFAAEWLRQARASEHLMIRAILERSADLGMMAWAVHPNVAAIEHAEHLASLYFPKEE